jgi:hypothetical protein
MRRAATALAFLFTLSAAPEAHAADHTDNNYQTWISAALHGPVRGHVWYWTDVHFRFYENFQPYWILLRPGISWRVGPPVYLTLGYAWTPNWARPNHPADNDLEFIDEHRAWEQIMWTPTDERTGVGATLRGRLEQRMRPQVHRDTGLRLRVLVRGQVPLSQRVPLSLIVWDEVFVALNDAQWGQHRGFDQNRSFIGLGWQIRPTIVRLEVGYQTQWIPRNGADVYNHILGISTALGWPQPKSG